ncbi:amidohydrolase [Aurantiacibacter suaedae]|uniref:amidohydrolase n=1 Tax=Aurantiacibacter suaedae TaxID=2545755 RepID=UPI0010F8A6A5|nr:amidohydrolase [Aurantiacibacter suaedae]
MSATNPLLVAALAVGALAVPFPAQAEASPELKAEVIAAVEAQRKDIQVMVDTVFAFAEPGFQEVRTSEYLSGILEQNGFTIERGVAGIPTAFTASWSHGSGGPKIALGSDIDGLLGLSQMPGVPEITPIIEGAPGHGEGHNSGMPLMIAAALAAKKVMEAHDIDGTLMLWPGVAEELLATKAYYVRAGMFDGVDASIFAHVSNALTTGYGNLGLNGMISVEYTFHGKPAHAAGMPWDGRSALDAVTAMDVLWNMRREHLQTTQRSHSIVTNGGNQPNIVPETASAWYFFRDNTFANVRTLYETGNTIADAAALGTGTTVTRRVRGYAAPNFGNKPLAEAAYANMEAVGMPAWTEGDQTFARRVQEANELRVAPLAAEVGPLSSPELRGGANFGASDDIGDVMWTVPTITIGYPANIPNVIYHHQTAAMAMATPIAHKGVEVGAKAAAMTVLDIATTPELVTDAWTYFNEVQAAEDTYDPLLAAEDMPTIEMNKKLMDELRPEMKPYYYDPSRFDSYLDQLGVDYTAGD